MSAGAPDRLRIAALTGALVAGYAASVLFSLLISRPDGHSASIWPANGFLVGAMILLGGSWRALAIGLSLGFQVAVSLVVGDGPARALLQPPVNLVEAATVGALAVRFCGARDRRLTLGKLGRLLVVAIAPGAMVGGVFGAVLNRALLDEGLLEGWLAWAVAGGIGTTIVLPTLLLLARTSQYPEFHRSMAETAALLTGLSGAAIAVFYQSELPLLFVLFPSLTLIALRLGPPGAAVACSLVAMICLPLAMLGHGPVMLASGLDAVGRVRLAEAMIVAVLVTTLATAGAIADQARLRRLMLDRDRAVRAARARARTAERRLAEHGRDARRGGQARAG
ncbi:MAG TPA: MASE1 domain-containing protein [Caulobacteraceae bacterium]|nr:MASE1 domain-containing protein [Caulobacteraceae bacterium]